MAIRRHKLDRNANLIIESGVVVNTVPGWSFTIDCPHHGKIAFDFNPYRRHGREELARQMRDAIWNLQYEVVGSTLQAHEVQLRTFWRYLDDLRTNGEEITRLDQIDRSLVDRFLAWMELQTNITGTRRGLPFSLGRILKNYGSLKSLLVNRLKRTPDAISPDLVFPRNPFPNSNQRISNRPPYSPAEQEKIDEALNGDLRTIYEGEGKPLSPMQVLTIHLLVLARTTGRNLQPLLELRRDSLQDHPLADRDLLVTYKRRGYSTHATSLCKEATENDRQVGQIPAHVGDYIRWLCDFTHPLAVEATDGNSDFAFLRRITKGPRTGQVTRLDQTGVTCAVTAFARRHKLKDDHGQPLALNMARLRPTFGHELYRRTRDIRSVQQALGHANAETTARRYAGAPLEAERNHAIVLEAMVCQYTRMEVDGKTLLAADGQIPLEDVPSLLSDGYSTGIARCRNPFRDNGTICAKFFRCFSCPSMIIFEDDLWRLFSFYYRLLHERTKISPVQWLQTYGPIIRRIDADIVPQFPAGKVEEARLRAQSDPHPTWKRLLL